MKLIMMLLMLLMMMVVVGVVTMIVMGEDGGDKDHVEQDYDRQRRRDHHGKHDDNDHDAGENPETHLNPKPCRFRVECTASSKMITEYWLMSGSV